MIYVLAAGFMAIVAVLIAALFTFLGDVLSLSIISLACIGALAIVGNRMEKY